MNISVEDVYAGEDDSRLNNKHVGDAVSMNDLQIALESARLLANRFRKRGYGEMIELIRVRFKGIPKETRMLITVILQVSLNSDHCKGSVSREVFSNWCALAGETAQRIADLTFNNVQQAVAKIGEELAEKGSEVLAALPA